MLEITDNSFAELVYTTKKPILIMFTAKWCSVCNGFQKRINDLEELYKNKVIFGKVDVDESYGLSSGLHIDKLPTFIIYHNKEPISYIIGAANLSDFKDSLNDVL